MHWPLLDSLTPSRRDAVLAATTRRRLKKGQALFHEGDQGNALFLIERGHAAVRLTTEDGQQVTVLVLGPGASVGELALLDERRTRSAAVVALDALDVLRIERQTFAELVEHDPGVQTHVLHKLVASVQRSTTLYAEALHLSADRRVKRRLVELADLYRGTTTSVVVRLTHDDIATVAGTSRQTVTEVLGDLADRGIVHTSRGSLRIDDIERLRNAAR